MTKKEIISKHVLCSNIFYNYHASENVLDTTRISTIEKIMQEYADQQTATLYTLEEVQKIVENVREAVIKLASADVCCDYRDNTYAVIDTDKMRSLDLNQFIKK